MPPANSGGPSALQLPIHRLSALRGVMTRFQMPRRVAISAPRRRQQGLRVAIATFVLGVALPALALAGSYYVSTSGSDSNAGTQAAPWRTIAKANATLNAGDVVFISP